MAETRETDLLRVEQVQRILGVGRSTVYELAARHELPVVRIGRLVRIPRAGLAEWIASRTAESRSDSEAA